MYSAHPRPALDSSAVKFIHGRAFLLHFVCSHRSQYPLQNAKCLIDVQPLVFRSDSECSSIRFNQSQNQPVGMKQSGSAFSPLKFNSQGKKMNVHVVSK